jgi:thiol-disulfide isomerase/thioredoxin
VAKRLLTLAAIIAMGLSARSVSAGAEESSPVEANDTAARLAELEKKYADAQQRFETDLAQATHDDHRRQLSIELQLSQIRICNEMLELLEKEPERTTSARGLRWIVLHGPLGSPPAEKALALLVREHLDADEMADVCRRLISWSPSTAAEAALRSAQSSLDRRVQAYARYSLAVFLRHKANFVIVLQQPGSEAQRRATEQSLGRDTLAQLLAADSGALFQEAERLLEQARAEYADVAGFRGSVADMAEGELHEMRDLALGKPAPEISGVDIEGRPLRLSDFRGKVVMLNFWGTWCPRCHELLGHQRGLMDKWAGKPFALVGVVNDENQEVVRRVMADERITWPNWFDGDVIKGQIAKDWNVVDWPTTYMMDAQGIIRFKKKGAQPAELDAVIAQLIGESARGSGSWWPAALLLIAAAVCFLVVVGLRLMRSVPGPVHPTT